MCTSRLGSCGGGGRRSQHGRRAAHGCGSGIALRGGNGQRDHSGRTSSRNTGAPSGSHGGGCGDAGGAPAGAAQRATTLVVGPGLGTRRGARNCSGKRWRSVPTVLDADGLNGLAQFGLTAAGRWWSPPIPARPHVCWVVQQPRDPERSTGAARALARRLDAVAVLKGVGSLIAAAPAAGRRLPTHLLGLCAHGNPGMASAGMGDVLSGVIGGLLAQGMDARRGGGGRRLPAQPAADRAAQTCGMRSLLATDLLGRHAWKFCAKRSGTDRDAPTGRPPLGVPARRSCDAGVR
jgi:hypothetical protein